MPDEIVKICKIHGNLTIDQVYFPKDRNSLLCKKCISENNRKWKKANSEKIKEYNREWAKANPEKVRKNSQKWAKSNSEKSKEKFRKWAKNNPEKIKEYSREWRKNNPEKIDEHSRKRVENLSEAYIKWILKRGGYDLDCISEEFIEAYKELIRLKRKIKEM